MEDMAISDAPGDFVKTVEYQTIPPHHNSDRIVAETETVGADEKSLGLREKPDAEDHEQIDKVT